MFRMVAGIFLATFIFLPAQSQGLRGAQTHAERANNGMAACLKYSPDNLQTSKCYAKLAARYQKLLSRVNEDMLSEKQIIQPDRPWKEITEICMRAMEGGAGGGQGLRQQRCEISALAARLDIMGVAPDLYPLR